MTIVDRVRQLAASHFVRSVGVLIGGTAIAQAIMMLALPLLTRLYTPADFGVLAVLNGMIAVIAVAACLRFDIAVPLPDRDEDAINLLALAASCALIVAAVVGLVLVALPRAYLARFVQPAAMPHLWIVPTGAFLTAVFSALQFWCARQQRFGAITKVKIAQSAATSGAQIGLSGLPLAPLGLLLGPLLNAGAGVVGLAADLWRRDRALLRQVAPGRFKALFVEYSRFPRYSTLEALLNIASLQVPVIMIAALATTAEAGQLMLATFAMQVPMALFGSAVAQVYLSKAAGEHRQGTLRPFTQTVLDGLMRGGVGPILFGGIVAPEAMSVVFGADWRRAGILVAWMVPWFVMQFLASPVSSALLVTGSMRTALALQMAAFTIRVASVAAAARYATAALSEIYAISGFVVYAAYLAAIMGVLQMSLGDLAMSLRRNAVVIARWAALGVVVHVAFAIIRSRVGAG